MINFIDDCDTVYRNKRMVETTLSCPFILNKGARVICSVTITGCAAPTAYVIGNQSVYGKLHVDPFSIFYIQKQERSRSTVSPLPFRRVCVYMMEPGRAGLLALEASGRGNCH